MTQLGALSTQDHEALFAQLGIDTTVSATRIIFNLLEQEIESDQVVPLAALSRGNLEIVQVDLSPQSPVVGQRIGEVRLPAEAHIVSVIRSERGLLPTPDTVLQSGDSVLALVHTEREGELIGTFAGA